MGAKRLIHYDLNVAKDQLVKRLDWEICLLNGTMKMKSASFRGAVFVWQLDRVRISVNLRLDVVFRVTGY